MASGSFLRRASPATLKFLIPPERHGRKRENHVLRPAQDARIDIVGSVLSKISNPMNATLEELRLMKPSGFTSKWADLGKTTTSRIATPYISYDHGGQYGEFSEFEYSRLTWWQRLPIMVIVPAIISRE